MDPNEHPTLIDYDRWKVRKFGLYYPNGPGGKPTGFLPLAWEHVEGGKFIGGRFIDEICKHLQASILGFVPRLIINQPPGTGKSVLSSVITPAYGWTLEPGLRWTFGSYAHSLVVRDGQRTLDLVSSPWYQARWPHVKVLDRSATNFRTSAGGRRFATTMLGQGQGWHSHMQVLDDPLKPPDGKSASAENTLEQLDKIVDRYRTSFAPRLLSKLNGYGSSRIVVMQRLHEADITNYFLTQEQEKYTHLCLPMRYEPKRACRTFMADGTPLGGDWRTQDGELLCPELKDDKAVKQLEIDLNIHADSQLQQRPTRAGGQMFLLTWMKFYEQLPAQIDEWLLSWDMTFKDTMGSDFVCGQVWARTGARFFLVDRVYDRMNFPQTLRAFQSQCRAYPQALAKLVEDKANGSAVIAMLTNEVPGMIAVEPRGSKVTRANAVSPLHRQGNVWYPDPNIPGKAWIRDHVKQMLGFPLVRHDDSVDAETQALTYWIDEKGIDWRTVD